MDPGEMASSPSDYDLQCFQQRITAGSAGQWLIRKGLSELHRFDNSIPTN